MFLFIINLFIFMTEQQKKDEAAKESRTVAALSYIWILCLVPLLTKKNDDYCQFHAKQGLVLFIVSFGVMILGMIPVIGWFLILPLGWMFIVILSILGLINALQGKKWEMPFLSKYAKQINL